MSTKFETQYVNLTAPYCARCCTNETQVEIQAELRTDGTLAITLHRTPACACDENSDPIRPIFLECAAETAIEIDATEQLVTI